ncbi:MAG: UDP-N-acetylmuramate dehydrogenase [Rikenellaceae bacterium]
MITVFNNITIESRNSFHLAVEARSVVEYSSTDDLRSIFDPTNNPPSEWIVVSGGNNILFTKDVEPTILTPIATAIEIVAEDDLSATIRVEAAAEWDDVVEWCVERGLWGAENLSLIPGKAGAAPVQNIGAYGVEIKDVVEQVECFDTTTLDTYILMREECRFAYRESIFKHELKGRVIVTAITLRLSKIATPRCEYADVMARVEARGGATLRNIRDVICEIRREKLPDTTTLGNAGSFFKNPAVANHKVEELIADYPTMPHYPIEGDQAHTKLAAGWLIDQVGMKGYREGAAGVHDRQALVLVNYGGATGEEIIALARKIQRMIVERFGVEIETEVNIL